MNGVAVIDRVTIDCIFSGHGRGSRERGRSFIRIGSP